MTEHIDPKITTIQRIYAAAGRADVGSVLAELTDDVDWASEAVGESTPWHGSYRGKTEVARFFKELGTAVEIKDLTPLSITTNETDVMVVIRWTFTARTTGRTATMHLYHWWRFDGDKVAFYRGSYDSELTASLFARAPVAG